MEDNIIRVGNGRIETTDNPKKHLITTGLDSCVGIGIKNKENNKRDLGHLLYTGDAVYGENRESNEIGLTDYDRGHANKFLDELLKLVNFFNPKNTKAYAVANLFRHDFKGAEINPMLEYVVKYFKSKDINILVDKESTVNKRKIYWKGLVLHSESADALYYGNTVKKMSDGSYTDNLLGSKNLE